MVVVVVLVVVVVVAVVVTVVDVTRSVSVLVRAIRWFSDANGFGFSDPRQSRMNNILWSPSTASVRADARQAAPSALSTTFTSDV